MQFFFQSKKFSEPLTTTVYTTTHVMKEGSLIKYVAHELDGDWQFMGEEPIEDYTKVAMLISLEQIINHDKSVLKVADLPMGYQANRNSRADKWIISKITYSDEGMEQFGFYCASCGIYHRDVPMAYGADAPQPYYLIPNEQREERSVLTADQCLIDEAHYYIRGQVELKVEDHTDNFFWNVWVEISKVDFERTNELWNDVNRALEPPYYGKIASTLEPYPETYGLAVKVITQEVGLVPKIELEESDHPLYLEQESGIDMKRVLDFAKTILYNH